MEALQQLQIQQALVQSYNQYAEGIDSKNWTMVRDCFADQVCVDYGDLSAAGGAVDVPRSADEWVNSLRSVIDGFDTTRHIISNHRFSFSGEEVSCRAYLSADHVIFSDAEIRHAVDDEVITFVGEYHNHYQLCEGTWKIVRSKLSAEWTRGNATLFERAAERAAALNELG